LGSATSLVFGAVVTEGELTSRETAPNLFSPCLLLTNTALEIDPRISNVPSVPIIRPSAWKTPLRYSPRYLLFRYSSTNHNDRERITNDWTIITILEADPCPAADPVLTLESNQRLPSQPSQPSIDSLL